MKLKRVFPKISSFAVGTLHLSITDENCRDLQWFTTRYPVDYLSVEAKGAVVYGAEQYDRQQEVILSIFAGTYSAPALELAKPPRDYQTSAASLALHTGGLLVADELGLGKTVTAITMLADKRTLPALVVVYPHLQTQWKREFERFLPGLTVHITKKAQPYPLNSIDSQHTFDGLAESKATFPDVVITTYTKLSKWADHLAPVINSVIYDEVQELRRDESAKYHAAEFITSSVDFHMGLSATPIFNYGGEFYNIIESVRPGAFGTRQEFLTEHCTYNHGKAVLKDPEAFGETLRDLGLMVRRTRKDVSRELPKLNQIVESIDADLSHIETGTSDAVELAKVILRSGGSGFDKMRAAQEFDMRLRQITGIAKAPHVAAFVRMLVEETDEQVVLVGWHRAVYDLWLEHLDDLSPGMYTGSETPKQKQETVDRFLNGETKILILSLRSGAGLDGLQSVCNRIVFGELDWSPAVHEQCVGRLFRDGQDQPTFAYYLVADSGSDPIIAEVNGLKRGQLLGVIDPSGAKAMPKTVDPGHVKRLAEAYLQSRGETTSPVAI